MHFTTNFLPSSDAPDRGESEMDHRLVKKVAALENLLASKLAEFLDSSYSYSLRQLSSVAKTHLYKGRKDSPATMEAGQSSSSSAAASRPFVSSDSKPHPFKGGWCIQDYLTYDWYVVCSEHMPVQIRCIHAHVQ